MPGRRTGAAAAAPVPPPRPLGRPVVDLTGRCFGRLVVLDLADQRGPRGRRLWRCRCDCGAETVANPYNFRRGHKRCCGYLCPLRPQRRDAGVFRVAWAARAKRLWAKGMTLAEIGAVVGV